MRKIAAQQAKKAGTPNFRCDHCNTSFIMSYGVYTTDTSKRFDEPAFRCRDCAKLPRYRKLK